MSVKTSYLKKWREERWYDGKRELVLERDGRKCVKCGRKSQLDVHHKDGKGRGFMGTIDNSMDNLITLCDSCHRKAHAKRGKFLIKVAELWDLSDREIARRLHISHPTVKAIREELAERVIGNANMTPPDFYGSPITSLIAK